MRRQGVRLRSVQDDSNLEDVIRVALIGERNTEDSRRKSEAVKAGKRRQFDKADRLGGPVPDGYTAKVFRTQRQAGSHRVRLRSDEAGGDHAHVRPGAVAHWRRSDRPQAQP